jgi:hypothetical protein
VRIGVYPGSFNPPTIAHLAVATAALEQCGLDRVDLHLASDPLGKDATDLVLLDHREEALQALARSRPWLGVRVSADRLLADIAVGYDVLVVGADKWAQVIDVRWYADDRARDEALASLPPIAFAPRPSGADADGARRGLPPGSVVLDVHPDHHPVSASAVRLGRHEWMVPEAAEVARRTGAWIDPERYRRSHAGEAPGGSP